MFGPSVQQDRGFARLAVAWAVVVLALAGVLTTTPGNAAAAGGDSLTLAVFFSSKVDSCTFEPCPDYLGFAIGYTVDAGFPGGYIVLKVGPPTSPCALTPAADHGAPVTFDDPPGEQAGVGSGPGSVTVATSDITSNTVVLGHGRHLVCAWLTEQSSNKVVGRSHLIVSVPFFIWDPGRSACFSVLTGAEVAEAFAIRQEMSEDTTDFPGGLNGSESQADTSVCTWIEAACSGGPVCTSPIGGLVLVLGHNPETLSNMESIANSSDQSFAACRPVAGLGAHACGWLGTKLLNFSGITFFGAQLCVVKGRLGLSVIMLVVPAKDVPTVQRLVGHPVDSPTVDTPSRLLAQEVDFARTVLSLVPSS